MDDLITIDSSYAGGIGVKPRWPYRHVAVSSEALRRLEDAQQRLGNDLRLIITRAFEPGGPIVRRLHRLGRAVGSVLFSTLYPHRADERSAIFSSNGHDKDGTHVDVSVEYQGQLLRFLPFGVLSSTEQVRRSSEASSPQLKAVYAALEAEGFRIHSNPTEALQIHCDLISPGQFFNGRG